MDNFEASIAFIEMQGFTCTKINPTISFEECEKDKVDIFNDLQFKCDEK